MQPTARHIEIRHTLGLTALTAIGCLLLCATFGPGRAQAAPPVLWEQGAGSGAGQVNTPRGSATAPLTAPNAGNVFVVEQGNDRISEFTSWGEFVKAWGWNVAADGDPGDTAPVNEFEICTVACQAGTGGSAGGQFDAAGTVAVDADGDVYAYEPAASRIQKFAPSGQFLRAWGWDVVASGVNDTDPVNEFETCIAADNDVCKAGVPGSGEGQLSGTGATGVQGLSTLIDVSPSGNVIVGENGRIQSFDTAGEFQAEVPLVGETVQHLAVDATENFYVAYRSTPNAGSNVSKPNVFKLSPAGTPLCTYAVASNPRGLDVAPDGQVYVFNNTTSSIMRFDSSCTLDPTAPLETFGSALSSASTGLAVNNCDTSENSVYHSNNSSSFLRAYSQVPDPDLCGAPPVRPPVITDTHALAVATDGATVRARVNPRFWEDTAYYVEYATAACIAADGWIGECVESQPAAPGTQLSAGISSADVLTKGVHLLGLQPDTAYHYRFVAGSSGGGPVFGEAPDPGSQAWEDCVLDPLCGTDRQFKTFPADLSPRTDCANQQFRVGPSANLPDCRAYEMVSPLDKNDGNVNHAGTNLIGESPALSRGTRDGDGLTYSSYRAFGEVLGAPKTSQYLARRDEDGGWSNDSISPPMSTNYPIALGVPSFENQYASFTEDLCRGWLFYDALPPLTQDAVEGYPNLYRRENCGSSTGSFAPLVESGVVPVRPAEEFLLDTQGASENGHLIFRISDKLTANAPANDSYQLYESYPGGLRAVCVLPGQTEAINSNCSAGTANHTLPVPGGTNTPILGGRRQGVENAISDDGSRIFWSAGSGLYVRSDGTETIQIGGSGARFHTAAVDGSAAIFSVGGALSHFDVDEALDLKEEGKTAEQIMDGATTEILGGLVNHILGASEDASHVYFVSTQVPAGVGENSEGASAQGGQNNAYYHEVGSGQFQFIGSLTPTDIVGTTRRWSPVNPFPAYRTAQVSAEGEHVAFMSHASLTGADNIDRVSGNPLAEVFIYDADEGKLACVSCSASGARPAGRNIGIFGEGALWAAARLPHPQHQTYKRRPLSEDGSRFFFESFNPLVLGDTNGSQDVYEFKWADERGECDADGAFFLESQGGDPWGCVALISTGKSPTDSEFMDADRTGDNVFIATESSLVPQDYGLRDAYVARVEGGFAPPEEPAECEGEACQGPAAPPAFDNPSSSSFKGPGNAGAAAPARCNRKQVRRGKRCVAKRALAKRACAKRKGKAKRRCVNRQVRRLNQVQRRRQIRAANTSGRAGR